VYKLHINLFSDMEKNIAKCDICNKEFNKVAYRNRHVKNVHIKNSEDGPKVKYTCVLCDKQYNTKFNLQRHIAAIHLPESQAYFTCKICNYKTFQKCHLERHTKKVHKDSKVVDYFRPHKCTLCGKQFKVLRRLRYHERKSHNTEGPGRNYNVNKKCSLCKFKTRTSCKNAEQEIKKHYESVHNLTVEIEKLKFSSMDEFFEWKKETEKNSFSFFRLTCKTPKTMVFRCHRSGVYKARGSNKRHLKIMGSCKIGGFCPAMIKVKTNSDESVSVYYTSKHIGHKLDLKHVHLTKEERNRVATQLASKIPHDEILKGVRSSLSNNCLKRIHLMNKKDLINIEKSFNLNNESIKHPFDPVSVEAWVQELKMSKETAILVYKPQGITSDEFPLLREDDFFLMFMTQAQMEIFKKYGCDVICIDGTHGLNNYNFQLFTILVLDECREGFPCAFLFSNRGDTTVLRTFLDVIKLSTGSIKPKVFMSDMAEEFFSAWEQTMGPPQKRLFCTWHVLKAWRKNINLKIKNQEKRDKVSKILNTLLYELDLETFKKMLGESLMRLNKDPETQDFFDYFITNYVNEEKFTCWAYCHRANAGVNTNMSLENFNRVLKYCYLRGKKVKRLDKTLCAILHLIKDKLFDLVTKIEKGKLVSKIRNLRTRHKSSLALNSDQIITLSHDTWHVLSSTQNEFYTIKRIKHCTKECLLVCTHCNSCFHEFICSCLDNAIRNNMCKHIHLVCRSKCNISLQDENSSNLQNNINDTQNILMIDTSEEEKNSIEHTLLDELSCTKEKGPSPEDRKIELLEQFKSILDDNSLDTEEEFQFVKNTLKHMIPTLKALKSTSRRPLQVFY
jgi:hypothetical protein